MFICVDVDSDSFRWLSLEFLVDNGERHRASRGPLSGQRIRGDSVSMNRQLLAGFVVRHV